MVSVRLKHCRTARIAGDPSQRLPRTPIAGLLTLLNWWMRWRRQWFRVDRLIVVEAAAQRERSSQKGER